jgi:DNA-binding transcriptional LysR family regulator
MTELCAFRCYPAIDDKCNEAIHFRMAQASFDWTLVRSFLAVLDAGSLMGAARKLGAQQPTLSRHVAELETQLGAPLFERTGRGVVPTAAALALAEPARRMQDAAEAMSQGLAARTQANTGVVRISTSDVAATWLMPPILAALRLAEPGIQIELVASNQLSNLLRREADIAVRMVRPVQTSLVARKLGEVTIVAAAHESYLEREGAPRTAPDLAQHRLIGYDRDETILRGFARFGLALTREHFALRTDDQVVYGQLVAAGAGIGFVAQYNIVHWPGVRAVPLSGLTIPPLPCWLAVHREIRSNRVVRRVYDHLAATIPSALEAAAR